MLTVTDTSSSDCLFVTMNWRCYWSVT